ncbi:hypothetical protein MIZ01_1553 [Sideroxyarcus emersonii]|uniref:AsmA-like C-terminal domain-containing protein n=1 Tax=Sideroxyarcus emersonii TaxID=2764705 RepID=A0AAN2BZ36_9PROT|nr:AsmA-like C-terminal region-containing protein [Sideroxyarcus emersonii]BCK87760.1 hypothetical protein MIZ01_1553 [Sideroxyarcus emersonii]
MDKKTIFIKTAKGEQEGANLSSDLKRILSLIDSKSTSEELAKRAPPSLRASWDDILRELIAGGYIRDKNKPHVEPKITAPKISPPKMFVPKPPEDLDLDFNTIRPASAPNAAEQAARQKAEEAARARSELEAAMNAAKMRANADAIAKAEAKARQEAEMAERARAVAEAKAKQEALIREQAEARAKQEAAARMQAQQEAARAKAALEAAAKAKAEAEARVRAEIEAAARAQQEAEAKAKREAEAARLKAEQEAARIKAEMEAAAKARAEAEAKAIREAEIARLKAEEEAARIKAELEAAAKAKAEAEARAKREAEIARLKAEEEAARVKAELEAAAKAKAEAEAARLKAEEEAARVKAELEAARIRAEAEAQALAEARAKQIAEEKARQEAEARLKAEQEEARIKAEKEAAAKAQAEAIARREAEEDAKRAAVLAELEAQAKARAAKEGETTEAPAFEIKLDEFLGPAVPESPVVAHVAPPETPAVAEGEEAAQQEAAHRAEAEAQAKSKAESGKQAKKSAAAEMERLKQEAEAARHKADEDRRRQAEEQALAEEQAQAWAEAEHRAKAQAILEAEQAAQQAALSQAKATTKAPVARKPRKPLPLGKIAFSLIALALLVVIVLPYVYPLKEYIAPLEQRLSAQLNQPVHIGELSAASLPPRLQLRNVTVGNAQEVKVGAVVLNFNVFSLLSSIKVINEAELQDVSIEGSALGKQAASLKLLGGNAQFPVRHLTLQHVKIVTDEVALPTLDGIAELDAQGAFSRVALHSPDDKFGVDLQNSEGRWQLGLNLKESSLPVLPAVVFSDLSVKGALGDGEINFTEMDAHIFNGILLGNAKLSWKNGWQLQGSLDAKMFDLDKMFPKFHVEGEMSGEALFSMAGAKLSQMDDAPHLDGNFTVKKGTVNVDIVETARLLSRDNLVGGRTHFDEMIGQVLLDNRVCRIRQLKIVSGMLSSNGSFEVNGNNQLVGTLNAEIKMRAGNNVLTLFGTPAEPKLRAGR